MNRIQILDEACINQIAAGEVIERPSSVVKELVENSIDAGATQIDIHLENGGKDKIQVKDNGSGISPSDLDICFHRYTTSKIKTAQDIFYISTNGFRGEALSSIASVSILEIESRNLDSEVARKLTITQLSVSNDIELGREKGTTITVNDLFYNTPVRKKFLSSSSAEAHRVVQMITRLALVNTHVSFRLFNNGKQTVAAIAKTHKNRIGEILGVKYLPHLIEVDHLGDEGWLLKGFIGDNEVSKSRRTHQYFYLEGRPIQNPMLSKAVEKAYHLFHPGRHPVLVLNLDLPPETYDINVHPTKKEVRFHNESTVFSFIFHTINNLLRNTQNPDQLLYKADEPQWMQVNEPSDNPLDRLERLLLDEKPPEPSEPQDLFSQPELHKTIPFNTEKGKASNPSFLSQNAPIETPQIYFLQVNDEFLLVETQDRVLVIHQYNAHYRVLFDQYITAINDDHFFSSQQLMFPEIIEFSIEEASLLEEHIDRLFKLGFDLTPFGGSTFKLSGIPSDLDDSRARSVLEEFLLNIQEKMNQDLSPIQHFAKSLAASRAIRKGKSLNQFEMNELFENLMTSSSPYTSPSGKPTLVPWALDDLAKKFK